MTRYFFDVHDIQFSTHDHEGTDCRDRAAVSAEALKALCQIAEDHPERYADQGLNVVVRGVPGAVAATLNLSTSWHAKDAQEDAA